jgi:hypothetical protein
MLSLAYAFEKNSDGGNFRRHYPGVVGRSVEPEDEARSGLSKAVAQVAFAFHGQDVTIFQLGFENENGFLPLQASGSKDFGVP